MPSLTRFSFDEYCRNPSHPAQLEARLTTTPLPENDVGNLSLYAEPTFPGYQRKTGPRETLFRDAVVGSEMSNLDLKVLGWIARGGFPVVITACLIVATFPGENPQLVGIIPLDSILTEDFPGICVAGVFQTDRVIV